MVGLRKRRIIPWLEIIFAYSDKIGEISKLHSKLTVLFDSMVKDSEELYAGLSRISHREAERQIQSKVQKSIVNTEKTREWRERWHK
jgi:hypothetical protein